MENMYLFQIVINNTDKLTNFFLLLASSIVIRQSVIFAGQNWIRTKSHTITLLLLPIITHAITAVISNNIALSLGMVGALSIVRFRNPVKSPFELVVYFLLITAGITASTDIKWLIILITFSASLIVGLEFLVGSIRGHDFAPPTDLGFLVDLVQLPCRTCCQTIL